MNPIVNLLIVEDEVLTAMFLQHKMERQGFNILKIVSNGKDAIDAVTKLSPQAILMDIRLAGSLDGITTAETIIASSSPLIIFMTGYAASDYIDKIKTIPDSIIFEKPIQVEVVANRIRNYLQNKNSTN